MSLAISHSETFAIPQNRYERLELARDLFHKFYAICFWHSPKSLEITEELIPFVIKGLRAHGGHLGFKFAGVLQAGVSE